MLDESNNLNLDTSVPPPTEEPESSNRSFLILGGIMAALFLLTVVCFGVWWFVIRPGQASRAAQTQTAVEASNARQIQQMTANALATSWTRTPLPSPLPTDTDTPVVVSTETPVVAQPSDTPEMAAEPLTATLAALQTQLAETQLAVTVTPQATAMPKTGFADEVGLPGLIIMAFVLVVVILLARRLRRAPIH